MDDDLAEELVVLTCMITILITESQRDLITASRHDHLRAVAVRF